MEPLITNERGEREWLYICSRVGEDKARAAIGRLQGGQRPYPLNIARVLGVEVPDEALLPVPAGKKASPEQVGKNLAAMRQALK